MTDMATYRQMKKDTEPKTEGTGEEMGRTCGSDERSDCRRG